MTAASPKLSPSEIVANLRDVTVTYDGYLTRALARVNLDIRRGEITAILGPKGAGKSTTLRLLAGRLRPTEGSVKVFDRSPRSGAAKARIGYLPGKMDSRQAAGFLTRLVGGRAEAASAGRGVARLTQAMLGNRDLLILDDPFLGLEPAEVIEAKSLIRDLAARGKTVILSGDSLLEVKDFCHRMALLHDGRVQAAGTLTELLGSGEALRFFPSILPHAIVGRVLTVLRQEILATSSVGDVAPELAQKSAEPTLALKQSDQKLAPLTKPQESAPAVSARSGADDSIDHDKLEQLTKNKKPE